jgi:predicted outer membrane protein
MRKPDLLVFGAVLLFASAVRGAEGAVGEAAGPWPEPLERAQRRALETVAPALVRVHLTNKLEIALGRMAEERGVRPEVRRFGRLLAADLERADAVLVRRARSDRDLDLEAATQIVDHTAALRKHVADVEGRMKAVPGGQFDEPYLLVMRELVDEALELLDDAWYSVQDHRLRTELGRLTTLMEQHGEIARTLSVVTGTDKRS